jgi:cytidine deaminase
MFDTMSRVEEKDQTVPNIANQPVDRLIIAAKEASSQAYCRYSNLHVGAAVLTKSGDVFSGCNVENASFGLTICAERNAIFQMVAKGQRQIATILIYTPTMDPTTPCGACRQVINEFGPDAWVISACDGPARIVENLKDLLPIAFGTRNVE